MDFQALLSQLPQETLFVLLAYGVVLGTYLVAVPLALYAWINLRWYRMSKYERLGVYGLVFLFFPGMIVFAPFINLRIIGQGEV